MPDRRGAGALIVARWWRAARRLILTAGAGVPSPRVGTGEVRMASKVYVGNLSYRTKADDLKTLFAPFGTVASAEIVLDRVTGRSRGIGFVEMGSRKEAQAAIAGLHGTAIQGRPLTVKAAVPKEEVRVDPRTERGRPGGRRPGPVTPAKPPRRRPPALARKLRKPRPGNKGTSA
jgi:RNA recognition motif-containing protein